MPKFLTIGYGDQIGYDRTPSDIRSAAHENDARLLAGGAIMGITERPVQVRNPQASGIETEDGPYMRSKLPVAGFAIFDAASLDEAIKLVSQSPCAIANGVIEVWPLKLAN